MICCLWTCCQRGWPCWMLLLAGLAALSPRATVAAVHIEASTTKVVKEFYQPSDKAQVQISAARNEWEGFQLVVAAGDEQLTQMTVELTDFAGPDGAVIPSSQAEFFLEYYVETEIPSPCEPLLGLPDCGGYPQYRRDPGRYPDALVPFFDPYADDHKPVAIPFDIPAGDLQTVFVDLHVPAHTAPGDYSAELTVTSAGDTIAQVPVQLTVWDFEIPAQRRVTTSYGLVFSYIKRYHGGPDGPDEEAEKAYIRNYELAFHKHRVDLENMRATPPIEADEQGQLLPIDFTEFDAELAPRVDGSYYPDGIGINRLALKKLGPGKSQHDLTDEEFAEAARIVGEHLQEKGWLQHIYLYSLDEPWAFDKWAEGSFDKIAHDVGLLHSKTDAWHGTVMVTGPWNSALDQHVDIWCPDTVMYGGDYYGPGAYPGAQKYAQLKEAGRELWFYVCRINVPPFLGYDVDTKIGYEPRLLKWQAWAEGAAGFLFWTTNYWNNDDPWHTLVKFPKKFVSEADRHGNGILIYPGDHNGTKAPTGSPDWVSIDGPVMSYRFKQIRDGLEDWEMFLLAEDLGAGQYARDQASRVHRSFGQLIDEYFDITDPPWTLSEDELFDVRRNVALKVQHLLHPDRYPDPEAGLEPEPVPEPRPDVVEGPRDAAPADAIFAPETSNQSSGCTAGPGPAGLSPWIAVLYLLGLLVSLSAARNRAIEPKG